MRCDGDGDASLAWCMRMWYFAGMVHDTGRMDVRMGGLKVCCVT